ncbi:MAG: hypothetical protein KKF12_21275 [Proteobacteria bacterium]|nr:hypothetical protein [Desulfobacula sp.]MBU3951780.1 hypothetical protein [Pseudomonadota bacterium]MBU4133361.1 hypothetical protein [Pseudomonadota bacterium]
MAANTTPIFPGTVRNDGVVLVKDAAAVPVFSAGSDGSRLDKLLVRANVAGTLNLSLTNGTVTMPVESIDVTTDTTDILNDERVWAAGSLWLGLGWSLAASANQGMTIIAVGGDY